VVARAQFINGHRGSSGQRRGQLARTDPNKMAVLQLPEKMGSRGGKRGGRGVCEAEKKNALVGKRRPPEEDPLRERGIEENKQQHCKEGRNIDCQ